MTPEFAAGSHLLRAGMKRMAAAPLLLLTLGLITSCALAGTQEAAMRIADSGSYAPAAPPAREAILATDENSFAQLWRTRVRDGEPPQIDFANEVAVLLMSEEHSSGGWSIVPHSVRLEGTVLVVDATVEGPPPGGIASMALTQPWVVLAVSPSSIEPASVEGVRWD